MIVSKVGMSRIFSGAMTATVALAVAGCGGSDGHAPAAHPRAIALRAPPPAVIHVCERHVPRTLGPCPTEFPRHAPEGDVDAQVLTRPGYRGYLLSFNVLAFGGADGGHLSLGAAPRPFALAGRAGAAWPPPGVRKPDKELGLLHLVLVRRVGVGSPALLLRAPPYPRGGVHGGHVIVLWNSSGGGHLVSLHFGGYSEAERIRVAVAIARSE